LKETLKIAVPMTLPIMAGYIFLGISFGLLATSLDIPPLLPIFMSLIIYSGATQFAALNLLLAPFDPIGAFLLSLMVSARHVFYGITMLPIYGQLSGWKKHYTIFGLTDETFSLNVAAKVPEEADENWFYFLTSLLNQSYWVIGTTIGVILGEVITINTAGIEFILVAMFVAIFTEQWLSTAEHRPALLGLGSSLLALVIFGADQFMIPAMLLIIGSLLFMKPLIEPQKEGVND
jgi:4-azaleucine resistance transporter AzlC